MDRGTAQARCELLRNIYHQVRASQVFFLGPDYLRRCGIQASQIGVLDGVLQFEPCFFLPNQVNILEFPTEEVIEPIVGRLDFPSLLSQFQKVFPESALEDTIRVYDSDMQRLCSLDDWAGNATDIICHVQAQLNAQRIGLPYGAGAGENLTHLHGQRTPLRRTYMARASCPEIALEWELEDFSEDISGEDLPHAIAVITAAVPANYAHQSITLHEVKCLVKQMWEREACGPFWRDKIHPLLLISYMGQRQGRITQATFDGERLTIQYSQPFSLTDEDQNSIELFLRYMISCPVRPGGLALPFRAPRHSADEHMDVDSHMLPELD